MMETNLFCLHGYRCGQSRFKRRCVGGPSAGPHGRTALGRCRRRNILRIVVHVYFRVVRGHGAVLVDSVAAGVDIVEIGDAPEGIASVGDSGDAVPVDNTVAGTPSAIVSTKTATRRSNIELARRDRSTVAESPQATVIIILTSSSDHDPKRHTFTHTHRVGESFSDAFATGEAPVDSKQLSSSCGFISDDLQPLTMCVEARQSGQKELTLPIRAAGFSNRLRAVVQVFSAARASYDSKQRHVTWYRRRHRRSKNGRHTGWVAGGQLARCSGRHACGAVTGFLQKIIKGNKKASIFANRIRTYEYTPESIKLNIKENTYYSWSHSWMAGRGSRQLRRPHRIRDKHEYFDATSIRGRAYTCAVHIRT